MSQQIKAIETVYKGYRFRSRLEARWAVFFDALGIKWEYEKEGYDLGRYGYYLPDFSARLQCDCSSDDKGYNAASKRLIAAYDAARSARFEHGESGAR